MGINYRRFSAIAPIIGLSLAAPFVLGMESVVVAQTSSDLMVEEFRLYREGVELFEQNRYPEAIATLEEALAIAQQLEDWDRQGRNLNYIGFIYGTLEDYPAALAAYQKALVAYRSMGDNDENGEVSLDSVYKDDELGVLSNIGTVYYRLGDYKQALEYHQKVLDAAQVLNNLGREQTALNNLGLIYSDLGQYYQALDFLERALALRSQVVSNSGAGSQRYNIGLVYFRLGEYDRALEFYEETLSVVRRLKDRSGEAKALNAIANVYSRQKRYEAALDYYQQALEIAKTLEIPSLVGTTLHNIGKVQQNLEDYEVALDYYQQALEIYQSLNRKFGSAIILNHIGEVYAKQQQNETGLSYYQQALAINQELEHQAGIAENFSNIAAILQQQQQTELAILFYKKAVNTTEIIRQSNRQLSSELQETYTQAVSDRYRNLADLLLQQNRILEAQQILDLLKVQELQDYLQNVRGNGVGNEIAIASPEQQIWTNYEDLTNQSIKIGQEIAEIRQITPQNRTETQKRRLSQLIAAQTELTRNFNSFINSPQIQTWVEQLSVPSRTEGLADNLGNLLSLRDNLRRLDQDAVLIYPLILPDRLELILVTEDAPPLRRTVEVSQTELNQAILDFRNGLQNPTTDITPIAQKLYGWLIQPLEADLEASEAKTLIYAPDAQLRYIPLAALHDGDNWLIERFRINNITAASLTELNSQPPTELNILAGAFANVSYPVQVGQRNVLFSPLPFAKKEVLTLAETLPNTTTLIDQDFSRDRVLPQMNDYNVLHFATHGAFVVGSPQDSFILFGDGKIATLADIQNWSLPDVDLVVLSACQTGLGGVLGTGEEILGLGYQFQRAGAKATVASLWSVDDGGTQLLMNRFYEVLQQPGITKAEALRQAQLALIQSDENAQNSDRGLVAVRLAESADVPSSIKNRLAHPYYWAAFVLIGNGL
ncbi:MAG: CHAT domain-containing protein [Jaaginema sp. PMC 1079.18]|nr:CHAT domain-containing protein [Jaaginema sp. PMC 1080.18]MEC4849969.1 CHAT domain-containing protein [Jaaginema sp. PMC 1079.18]MEC4866936.1 CHAT domain-containing protein [Jaaginema sp. PMC 1078.18]